MQKYVLNTIVILLLFQHAFAQNEEHIVREFIKAQNTKDTIKQSSFLHKDFVGVTYGDHAIFKNKAAYVERTLLEYKGFDRRFTISEIEEVKKDTITIYCESTDNLDALLKFTPTIDKRRYYLKEGKIVKIHFGLTHDRDKEEDVMHKSNVYQEIRKSFIRKNIGYSNIEESVEGIKTYINLVKMYKNAELTSSEKKEIEAFIDIVNEDRKKEFVSENDPKNIKAFLYDVLTTIKKQDFKALQELYVSENEFVKMMKHYGFSEKYGVSEFKENVFMMNEEDLKSLGRKRFYECMENYKIQNENYTFKFSPFSEVLLIKALKKDQEYYFAEISLMIECVQEEGFEFEEKEERGVNFGELIYIPKKGWRLLDKIR